MIYAQYSNRVVCRDPVNIWDRERTESEEPLLWALTLWGWWSILKLTVNREGQDSVIIFKTMELYSLDEQLLWYKNKADKIHVWESLNQVNFLNWQFAKS